MNAFQGGKKRRRGTERSVSSTSSGTDYTYKDHDEMRGKRERVTPKAEREKRLLDRRGGKKRKRACSITKKGGDGGLLYSRE